MMLFIFGSIQLACYFASLCNMRRDDNVKTNLKSTIKKKDSICEELRDMVIGLPPVKKKDSICEELRDMVIGLPSVKKKDSICEECIYGKLHRLPFPETTWRAQDGASARRCLWPNENTFI